MISQAGRKAGQLDHGGGQQRIRGEGPGGCLRGCLDSDGVVPEEFLPGGCSSQGAEDTQEMMDGKGQMIRDWLAF